MMGSPEDEFVRDKDEMNHEVTMIEGYFMQTKPVTQGQGETVLGNNGYSPTVMRILTRRRLADSRCNIQQ